MKLSRFTSDVGLFFRFDITAAVFVLSSHSGILSRAASRALVTTSTTHFFPSCSQDLFFPETIIANGLAGVTVMGMDASYAGGEFWPTGTDLLRAGGIE